MQLVQISMQALRMSAKLTISKQETGKNGGIKTMKKNKIAKAAAITAGTVALLAGIGSIAMGGYVADQILHQNADKDTHDNSLKQMEVWEYDTDAFNAAYTGVEISATAEDGNEVPGTYFDMGSDKCVILVHGAGGDRACVEPLAEGYLQRGYDVIAIDQRGCGSNPDDRVTFGIHESLDVKAMVEYARVDLENKEVLVHGQSMGAQTTAIYASNVQPGTPEAADAVICDSPVPGMELILKEMFGDGNTESFMANYLTGTSKVYMDIVYKINYDDADTIKVVANDHIPTLIICSDKDEVCLPDQVAEVYENVACEHKAIVHFDSAHIEGVIDDPEGYMNSVEGFLQPLGL